MSLIYSGASYWTFVCNPQKWAIDEFFDENIEVDAWGISAHKDRFAPGQLGIIRVGIDRRNKTARQGRPQLKPGIYAIVEVLTSYYLSTGSDTRFWHEDEVPGPGRPTVGIRYLRTFANNPLLIERIKLEMPDAKPSLLNSEQSRNFDISKYDFTRVLSLLGTREEDLRLGLIIQIDTPNSIQDAEGRLLSAAPEVKAQVSRRIERGPVGNAVKKSCDYKCQICAALGKPSLGFPKLSGGNYVEAHHVMPVSTMKTGVLHHSNIMVVCANHHRELHYGRTEIIIKPSSFNLKIGETTIELDRPVYPSSSAS